MNSVIRWWRGQSAVEKMRRFSLTVGAVAAAGLAEQHRDPAPVIAGIPWADTPLWTVAFLIAACLLLASIALWPRRPLFQQLSAGVFASVLTARGVGLATVYGFDLWGTIAQIFLTAVLIVTSWSWSGSTLRAIK